MKRIVLFIFVLINGYFWVGLGQDPEFLDWGPFIKARPCPKFLFSSPIGMETPENRKLSEKEAFEMYMFEQYFGKDGIQSNDFSLKMCDMDKSNMSYR